MGIIAGQIFGDFTAYQFNLPRVWLPCAKVSDDCQTAYMPHRTANVKISFRNYKGLRISQKALRILDGEKGVYVKSGYSVKFKKVDILYTGLDYYLCQIQYGSSDQLSLFDEVIVEGTDLYDGKPIDP